VFYVNLHRKHAKHGDDMLPCNGRKMVEMKENMVMSDDTLPIPLTQINSETPHTKSLS